MHDALQSILAIQELDIKMIRLMRVKKEHQNELAKNSSFKNGYPSQGGRKRTRNGEAERSDQRRRKTYSRNF